ncbi:MAG TPA: amino acid adenylation domain-containing protein, partial [Pyrinomonadaceae bacterium]
MSTANKRELLARLLQEEGVVLPQTRGIEARRETDNLPLSFAQQRLWFLDQLEPGGDLYNVHVGVRLSGALDAQALERGLTEIVRRHEVLRTVFDAVEGQPVQSVRPAGAVRLEVEDLSHVEPGGREEEARRRAAAASRRPFDLRTGPLVRANLWRLDEREHLLVLTMHHIVSDAWSQGVLIRELAALYQSFSAGGASPLGELPIQYADFARWQREWLQGETLESQLAYWRRKLGGSAPVLDLPADRPRASVRSFRGATELFTLPPELARALQALGREERATPFMTLLAAFKALLHLYTQQEDILVGSPIANRRRVETESLIGFFVNMLVLRTELEPRLTFRGLLRKVKETALGAFAHQDIPFEKLVEELQPERSLSHTPLFQVLFVYQNAPTARLELPGLTLSPFGLENENAIFDLSLSMGESGDGFIGGLAYKSDLFDRATIRRMVGHFVRLLELVAARPDEAITGLPLLADEESRRILGEWNQTRTDYDRGRFFPQLFEESARRTPDAPAVVYEGRRLTYAQLNARANQLAHYLRAQGVGPESLVGLCVERSPEMIVGVLGVLKAGGAYVPLDPHYPRERLAYMLADAAPGLLLTQAELADGLPEHGARVLRLDADWPAVAAQGEHDPEPNVSAESPAYMIYTSGSTGRPKGVLVRHGGLASLSEAHARVFRARPEDRVLQFASFSFDASLAEIAMTLRAGATLYLAPRERLLPGTGLFRLLSEQEITNVTLPPSVLAAMPRSDLPALRTLIVAGEACPAELVERWSEGRRFINAYGPTETTVWAAAALNPDAGRVPPIGRPIPNTTIYLLNRDLRPVPVGVAGELYVGGDALARGYYKRPALTAERFVPDPFGGEAGARLYRTGDLARYLPGGDIEFLGRVDNQVKVRGFRVEPGEIEAALKRHPAVTDAAVVLSGQTPNDRRLVAFVVAPSAPPSLPGELRASLKKELPEYMTPASITALDALPLMPGGKVDRRLLSTLGRARAEAESEYVAPRNATEEVLAGIWSQLLGLARVGVNDNFFDLGGHSLLASQAISRLRAVLNVEAPLRTFFEKPTVAELAAYVEACTREEQGLSAPPLARAERAAPPPLSFAQQRLWFLHHLAPANYNIPGALLLTGRLDADALERSFNEVARRHESLRTTFAARGDEPVQVIAGALALPMPVTDLRHLPEAERGAEARRLAEAEARRPFDLAAGPLLRVSLLRLSADEHVLLFTMHHIISDGWSIGVLVGEVAALYAAFVKGEESPLPELSIQYADFAVWQRDYMKGEALERQLSYWRERLKGAPPVLELPTDRPRPAVQTFNGAKHQFGIAGELAEGLRALSRREGVTLYMTLLAAFQTLLMRYTGQEDVIVGSPIAGRNRAEVEPLIGFFVNTLAMRTDLSGDPSFKELLGRVRETALGAYAHQDVPFEKLVEELQPERDTSHSPIFQVVFALQNTPRASLVLPGLEFKTIEAESGATAFDLGVSLSEGAEGIGGHVEYNTDLFDSETIAQMVRHYQNLLAGVVRAPEGRVTELPLLDEEERRRLLVEWGERPGDYDTSTTAHQLFEAQAARTPDAVALVYADVRLSYGELNRRANQLARYLRRQGVSAGTRVGIFVERSAEMVVGLLGILKAGGVFVPLDPDYPRERLSFMLEDSQTAVMLTHSRLEAALPEGGGTRVRLDADAALIAAEGADDPGPQAAPSDLAYFIYTSGTTGRPKAVMVEHRQLVNTLLSARGAFGFGAGDVMPVEASYSFDIWLFEALTPLAAGGRCLLLRREEVLDVERLVGRLAGEGATLLHAVPSLMRQVVEHLRAARSAEHGVNINGSGPAPPKLRMVFVGGDAVSPDLLAAMREAFPGTALRVLYGPTEAAIICTSHAADGAGAGAGRQMIGRPLSNVRLRVADARGEPTPAGVAGEIYIGGAGVSRGYHGREELTREKFVTLGGERYYRSGDVGRWRRGGELEFVGRADGQVKVRGFRVEVGEVEAVLAEHAGVREVAVAAARGAGGEKRLVAYVALRRGQGTQGAERGEGVDGVAGVQGGEGVQGAGFGEGWDWAGELRAYALGRLPEYMTPSQWVEVEGLPLTAQGKVDRGRLPEAGAGAA